MARGLASLCVLLSLIASTGCLGQVLPGGGNPTPSDLLLTYDGAIALTIRNGQTLPGTNLGYQGKSVDGRALLLIGPEQAPHSTADSVNFVGSPVAGSLLRLNTRVGTYDNSSVNLIGTVHLEIQGPSPQPGDFAADSLAAFVIPVQYNINKNALVPGSTLQYLGQSSDGARFNGAGQYPYRQQFDSVVWNGHLRDKVGLRLDLRLLTFSDDAATLVGSAQIRFEK